ncbi:pilus (MSHA type) biogenesis protein MshL [Neptuniibacter caesariensis]|uniref:Putative MSHA biogenesis protein MshL n=1 Tax=Neptuniibacter caesariensis TaxID=207954 RepID=A0A7U8C480_NEPCE|nr:pilus (MSHA type) biogenesis protein MshL [Neptuniibacter caesariensis]EAR61215.1 putative MSHA biogenesis protein MshL [Oceanospirillum sp. MED92] [Neptuniibacter caesariensis]
MKHIYGLLWIGCAALLAGCQGNAPIGGKTTQEVGVAALEDAIQNNQQRQIVTPPPIAPALLPPLNLQSPAASADERFDITAEALPAKDFFMGLVQGTAYNMIVHEAVGGNISLELKDVSVDEVMQAVQRVYGYEYNRTGNLYQVLPASLQTEIFQINYLDIQRDGTSDTQVSAGSVSNSGDNASGEEVIGTRISTKTSTNFWGGLQETLNTIVTGEGRKVVVTPQTGVVVVRALPSELATVRDYLSQAELILHRQVVIEAKILEVTLNNGFQAGVNWSILGEPGSGNTANFTQSSVGLTNQDAIGGIFKADLSIGDFSAVIELLGSQGDVQVLSSPRVSTVNNQKAVIKVGTDEFFVTEVENTTTTGTSTTTSPSIELTPFFSGIALDVTPQISANGDIVLHIHPTVSEVVDQQKQISVGTDDFNIPLALSSIRESDSIVRAESGQVIVIGGLMKSSDSDTQAKTPGLGDIPGVGNLFKQKRQAGSKTELVIMLRPVLANHDNLQNELKRSLRSFQNLQSLPPM